MTITSVELDDRLDLYYKALETDMIEVAGYFPNGDCLIVDEEGLLKLGNSEEKKPWFTMKGINNPQPLVKSGIVVGCYGEDWGAPKSSESDIAMRVTFLNENQAAEILTALHRQPLIKPEGVDFIVDGRFNPFEKEGDH